MRFEEWIDLLGVTLNSVITMNEREIIMDNYDMYNKLEKKLFYERIGTVKRKLATMVDKDKRERPPAFYYKGQQFRCNIAYASTFNVILVQDNDSSIINELEKIIKMEEQKRNFKQLYTEAVMETCLPSSGMKYLLGDSDSSMLIDEAICIAQAYNEDHPELLKLYRRLKLMAGNA